MKIKLLLSYDGTDFCGWQKQKDHAYASGLPSIQETLEVALESLLQEKISIFGSGRTDAGVHALGQVAHFNVSEGKRLPSDLAWALRAKLPRTIAVRGVWEAPEDFHATLSAERKIYRYLIWNHQRPSALLHRYSDWIRKPLNVRTLNAMSEGLIGEHDFKCFQSVGTPVKSTTRRIYKAQWFQKNPSLIEFKVMGNGFLKQMVRNIVGTLIELEQKGKKPQELLNIIASCDRKEAGPAAPPQGLYLYKVFYPRELDNKCRQF